MDLRAAKKQKIANSSSSSSYSYSTDSTDSTDSSSESVSSGFPQQQPIDKVDGSEISAECKYKLKGVATNIDMLEYGGGGLVCHICGGNQLKRLPRCDHYICDECTMTFITEMIQRGDLGFKCPKKTCTVMWTVDDCLDYLPREVADRLIGVIREAKALANPPYLTCPFHKCGALIIDNPFLIRACTTCWKLFCTRCRVDWHMGMTCTQYQALVRAADLMFD